MERRTPPQATAQPSAGAEPPPTDAPSPSTTQSGWLSTALDLWVRDEGTPRSGPDTPGRGAPQPAL